MIRNLRTARSRSKKIPVSAPTVRNIATRSPHHVIEESLSHSSNVSFRIAVELVAVESPSEELHRAVAHHCRIVRAFTVHWHDVPAAAERRPGKSPEPPLPNANRSGIGRNAEKWRKTSMLCDFVCIFTRDIKGLSVCVLLAASLTSIEITQRTSRHQDALRFREREGKWR